MQQLDPAEYSSWVPAGQFCPNGDLRQGLAGQFPLLLSPLPLPVAVLLPLPQFLVLIT